MPESAPTLDWSVLPPWMATHGLRGDVITGIAPIGGGTQNLMYRFDFGGRSYVLRRGPRHLRPKTNEALRREARLLTALAGTAVPAPVLVAAEPDETVLGSVFYLMDPVDGFNPSQELPALHHGDSGVRRRMGFAAVEALAALGEVDAAAVGLDDLGTPDGFLDRQVPQWLSALEKYGEFDGYDGHRFANIEQLANWLTTNQPRSFRPGLMHGDFHLANLMFRNDSPEVAAIVDWEMCTVGDPLLDLGWLLATWPAESELVPSAIGQAGGLPTRAELVDCYGRVASRSVDDATWYAVLASFKLAIVLEGTYARACAGQAPAETGQILHDMAAGLLTRAAEFIDNGL
ncbi:phosphotransferase family protein [Nocardia asteroides]|uniref:phosphotransferase family protein n=1 Tax=Nocardia asteroides TaxID=1824 RepID=UPI0037C627A2